MNSEQTPHYSMLIEWSDLDQAYILTLPEWERVGALANTHGATYAEAAQKGQELIAFLYEAAQRDGDAIPAPAGYDAHAYAPGETSEGIGAESEALAREIEAHPTPHAS